VITVPFASDPFVAAEHEELNPGERVALQASYLEWVRQADNMSRHQSDFDAEFKQALQAHTEGYEIRFGQRVRGQVEDFAKRHSWNEVHNPRELLTMRFELWGTINFGERIKDVTRIFCPKQIGNKYASQALDHVGAAQVAWKRDRSIFFLGFYEVGYKGYPFHICTTIH
jgi:hypothetical protein